MHLVHLATNNLFQFFSVEQKKLKKKKKILFFSFPESCLEAKVPIEVILLLLLVTIYVVVHHNTLL
jgi:hypothetical protein